jgi:hypothetical protein
MEHARKLKLIDSNFDTRNVKKRYSQLDKSISEVLESDESVDEREKARRYQQALNRFLVNRETVERELERPVEVEVTALPEEEKKRAAPRELSHYSAGVSKKKKKAAATPRVGREPVRRRTRPLRYSHSRSPSPPSGWQTLTEYAVTAGAKPVTRPQRRAAGKRVRRL